MVQEIAQVEIPSTQRSTFAGTEQSFRSLARKPRVGVRIDYEELPLEEIDPHAD
jgi:hypothetical protein